MSSKIQVLRKWHPGFDLKQLRAVRFQGANEPGLILAHADTPDQQPGMPDIIWPRDTLKISAFTFAGERLWQHDVGRGVIPGLWFCPVLPFDLNRDGTDEVFFVGNSSQDHPFDWAVMELHCLSGATGELLEVRPWPAFRRNQTMSDTFRYLMHGGYAHGQPRLITSQGCYHELSVHAWNSDLELLWKRDIPNVEPGCRASHMISVLDIDNDGRDEVLFGERCLDIDTGEDIWVADSEGYHGHSDIVMPTLDRETGRWSIYTCREFPWPEGSRGVVMFDDQGEELWGHRGMGHMHNGWTARLNDDGSHVCYAVEMLKDKQTKKISATVHLYDLDGKELEIPFPLEGATPVDIDGDGFHELVYRDEHPFRDQLSLGDRIGLIRDRHGKELGRLEGSPGNLPRSKLLDCPGEQIMTRDADGMIRICGCPDATDSDTARTRYDHPYYKACQRITAVGYNWRNLGGL